MARARKPLSGKVALDVLRQGIEVPGGKILKLIHPDDLRIDGNYQRGVVNSSVDRIKGKAFDTDALGVFQIGQRTMNKKLYVVDGQNRLEAIKQRKDNGDLTPDEVLCLVKVGTTVKQEAKMFVQHNTAKPVTGTSKFRARLVYGEEPELTIERWVLAEGFSLDFCAPGFPNEGNTKPNGIRSVDGLLRAYNGCMKHLRPALKMLRITWGEGRARNVPFNLRTGQVVWAIALFLQGQGDKSVEQISKTFRLLNLDIGAKWTEIKKGQGYGWDRSKELAYWLSEMCGGSLTLRRTG